MAITYNVYFGPTGSMVLVASGLSTSVWQIDTGPLSSNQEYSWQINTVNEYGTTYGDIWTFTSMTFLPPVTTGAPIQQLVGAAANAIWYENI